MKLIDSFNTFYFVGAGGIGMSAIARYFKAMGMDVLGYDKTETKLTDNLVAEGIKISFEDEITEDIRSLDKEKTLVVYTPAIKSLKILDYFREKGFVLYKRAKVLGLITQNTECIAVAGTHGKTTTSTLLSHLAKEAGLEFSCFLGGISENLQSNFHFGGSKYSVVEADEFDRSFLSLSPDWAIITSNDADHLDIYGDRASIEEGFREFARLVEKEDQLFVQKDISLGRNSKSYGVNGKADFYSDNLRVEDGTMHFDFHFDGKSAPFSWRIPGTHNVENATATIALLVSLGVSIEKLQAGLKSFKGIRRRYSSYQLDNDKLYVDDYAHHPTELNAVIGSIRTFYPGKKLLVVFQPHLYSRTRDFADDFAKSLENSDDLLLLDIYPAREISSDFPGISSKWLLDKVNHRSKEVSSLKEAMEKIETRDFDILLTVGAGNIDTLHDLILDKYKIKQ